LNYFVFFLFGMIVAPLVQYFEYTIVIYALLSLTIVRMLPVAISMYGMRLNRASVLFMGWFGPRGLASIVLGLIYLEREVDLLSEHTIILSVAATVFFSIFAHGVSALPGTRWYVGKVEDLDERAPELQDAVPVTHS
jgi:NhaP-type Na+/H+ or K+/H+ antiporter